MAKHRAPAPDYTRKSLAVAVFLLGILVAITWGMVFSGHGVPWN